MARLQTAFSIAKPNHEITFSTYTRWIPGKSSNQVDDLDMRPAAHYPHQEQINKKTFLISFSRLLFCFSLEKEGGIHYHPM